MHFQISHLVLSCEAHVVRTVTVGLVGDQHAAAWNMDEMKMK